MDNTVKIDTQSIPDGVYNSMCRIISKQIRDGTLACLKGLAEQGCDGAVTEAIAKIEKHINKNAHSSI